MGSSEGTVPPPGPDEEKGYGNDPEKIVGRIRQVRREEGGDPHISEIWGCVGQEKLAVADHDGCGKGLFPLLFWFLSVFFCYPLSLLTFARAKEIEHGPGQEYSGGNSVEKEMFLHARIGGEKAVIQAPETKTRQQSGEDVGADLRWG